MQHRAAGGARIGTCVNCLNERRRKPAPRSVYSAIVVHLLNSRCAGGQYKLLPAHNKSDNEFSSHVRHVDTLLTILTGHRPHAPCISLECLCLRIMHAL
jgi:hypothetical protein